MNIQKKDEDSEALGLFQGLDKSAVFQEARVFNESPIKPRKCRVILTKILYLLFQGQTFTTTEATGVFFNVIKLFQSKDMSLRQVVYLAIKELSKLSEDVIMVTSSLMKDMQPTSDTLHRGNAIRTLCKITEPTMIPGIERFLKAAIVDKNPGISSAALVSTYHLFPLAKDTIRRWANEVSEALNSKAGGGGLFSTSSSSALGSNSIAQYHALGLLYAMRQQDRMAVIKLVQGLTGSSKSGGPFGSSSTAIRNSMAHCMLIRYACQVATDDPSLIRPLYEMLDTWTRHRSDMVSLEASRAICRIKDITTKDLYPATSTLQLFLSSAKPVLRFAAIRTFNQLAHTHPDAVSQFNVDIENLVSDSNRGVAAYAITTLLKTGTEASVDRLMEQITVLFTEITDEFKIIVAEAVRSLCLKFPAKHDAILTFLSGVLRDEGSYEFKRAVVESLVDLVKHVRAAREQALSHLSEYIEDCEYPKLSVRILHVLGTEGPRTGAPTTYIRYIYNRIVLETAVVRAAAVNALAKFGVLVDDPAVKRSVTVLLTQSLEDPDNEVRDRAAWALCVVAEKQIADEYINNDSMYAFAVLERSLLDYCANAEAGEKPFDMASVPRVSRAEAEAEQLQMKLNKDLEPTATLGHTPGAQTDDTKPVSTATGLIEQQQRYAELLKEIPAFASYGTLFKSSAQPEALTESETEYVVKCTKHTFDKHIVFQFECTNTLEEQVLDNVTVAMVPDAENVLVPDASIPIERLEPNTSKSTYVSFKKADDEQYPVVTFTNTLKFVTKEIDPSTGEPEEQGFDDKYSLEQVELQLADHVKPAYLGEFSKVWAALLYEVVETFDLTAVETIPAATESLIELLGMQAVEGTGTPKSTHVHTLLMQGILLGGAKVAAKVRMGVTSGSPGVAIEMTVRSDDAEASQIIVSAL